MPNQLDPRYATDANGSRIAGLVFVSLLRVGADGQFEPYLAESWVNKAGKAWTFRLRQGFTFHDGTAVRASDVAATYGALSDPAIASPKRAMLERVIAIEVSSPTEVTFRLLTPAPGIERTDLPFGGPDRPLVVYRFIPMPAGA